MSNGGGEIKQIASVADPSQYSRNFSDGDLPQWIGVKINSLQSSESKPSMTTTHGTGIRDYIVEQTRCFRLTMAQIYDRYKYRIGRIAEGIVCARTRHQRHETQKFWV
jgi:hypothetical protein